MTLAALLVWLPSLVLHFVRIGAFLASQPLFGMHAESRMLRLVLMVALGALLFRSSGQPPVEAAGLGAFALLGVREALIGFGLGLAVRLLTSAMATAGEILSHEMGFAMAQVVDPATGRSTPVISQLFETTALLLVFQLDVHHDVLRGLAWLHEALPVGSAFAIEPVHARLTALIGDSLEYGMRYAMPVIGVMSLLTAALVMLARAVQNINLLEFTFGLRILLALLASVFFLTEGTSFLEHMFADLAEKARLVFAGP